MKAFLFDVIATELEDAVGTFAPDTPKRSLIQSTVNENYESRKKVKTFR